MVAVRRSVRHHEDDAAASRFSRDHRLNGQENETLDEIDENPGGRIALVVGAVAAAIHRCPAWALPFFEQHGLFAAQS